MNVLWVTAFRDLKRESWGVAPRPFEEYLICFERLKKLSPNLVCFVDEPHASIIYERTGVKTYPYDEQDTFVRHLGRQQEIIDSPDFKNRLPFQNWPGFIHAEYGIVNLSKACFVRRASKMFAGYTHYAWIDFGYVKNQGEAPPDNFVPRLLADKVMIRAYRHFHIDEEGNPVLGNVFSNTLEGAEKKPWNNPEFMLQHFYHGIRGNIWIAPAHMVDWVEKSFGRSIEMHHEREIANHDEPFWLPIIYEFPNRFHIDVMNGSPNEWEWISSQEDTRILWVTAFKDFGRESWSVCCRTNSTYFEAFERIKHLNPVCFTDDLRVDSHRKYPFDETDTFFGNKDLYLRHKHILETKEFWEKCPEDRKWLAPEYTYPDYSLMCFSKTSFLRRAAVMFPDYTHYAWIDFGFAKTPEASIPTFQNIPRDQIYISSCRIPGHHSLTNEAVYGNWGSTDLSEGDSEYNWNNPQLVLKHQHYMIQANSYVVPRHMTGWLEKHMEYAVERHYELGIVGHDEPVFLSIIHDFPTRFKINIKTDWTGRW